MNDAEIDFYITRILCGYLIFFYNGERYELRYPSNQLKYEANLLYNNIMNDEKYGDWIRQENLNRVLIMLGLWDKDTEKVIGQFEKRVDNLKLDIYKNFTISSTREKIRTNLRSTENQLNRILNIKNEFASNTLEGYASSIKHEFIVCNTLYKNNKLVFNIDNAKNNASYQYFNNLVNEINQHTIGIKMFKAIARSGSWRSFWNCDKSNILKEQVIDWTDEQRSLINITKMYDNIYEHTECPEEAIIDDDDALDGWLIAQKQKVKQIKKQSSIDSNNPNLKKAQEVFVMSADETDAEEILSLNSGEALHRMKEKFEFINRANEAEISDLELPDVQREARSRLSMALKQRKS